MDKTLKAFLGKHNEFFVTQSQFYCPAWQRVTLRPVPRRRKPKTDQRPVFDSIRKPTAPPSRKMDDEKAETRTDPVGRKAKHKSRVRELGEE